jgi:stage II sporulation protein D
MHILGEGEDRKKGIGRRESGIEKRKSAPDPRFPVPKMNIDMKSLGKIFRIIFVVILISAGLAHLSGADAASGNIVRVLIIDDKPSMQLLLKGRYAICEADSSRVLMEGAYLNTTVSSAKTGIGIGNKETNVRAIKIKVMRDSNIYVDGRRFRGEMDIIRKDNQELMAINHIDLDDYLYGVLYHEVSHRWPMEVLKAQAITARTFALYQARQGRLQPYDLRNDIYSQVYGGRTSEKWSTTRAVNLTRGKVLAYNNELLPAYYHATCAGYTEDASNLWSVDLTPLKGVPCLFCGKSPHYKWTKVIPLWKLSGKLNENGYKVGKIASVTILSRNKSGRVDKIEIKDDQGTAVVLSGKDFRQMIGPNELRSAKFDAAIKWGDLVLDGSGWGHGVGMCQWGAFEMARRGKKCEDILQYYYPGTEIVTIDKVKQ